MKKHFAIFTIVLVTLMLVSVQCSASSSATAPSLPASPTSEQPNSSAQTESKPAAPAETKTQPTTPAGIDAKTLTQQKCTECHSFNKVSRFKGDTSVWQGVVNEMIDQGLKVTVDEQAMIVKYLADTYK